jgi:hypothetical protein
MSFIENKTRRNLWKISWNLFSCYDNVSRLILAFRSLDLIVCPSAKHETCRVNIVTMRRQMYYVTKHRQNYFVAKHRQDYFVKKHRQNYFHNERDLKVCIH